MDQCFKHQLVILRGLLKWSYNLTNPSLRLEIWWVQIAVSDMFPSAVCFQADSTMPYTKRVNAQFRGLLQTDLDSIKPYQTTSSCNFCQHRYITCSHGFDPWNLVVSQGSCWGVEVNTDITMQARRVLFGLFWRYRNGKSKKPTLKRSIDDETVLFVPTEV